MAPLPWVLVLSLRRSLADLKARPLATTACVCYTVYRTMVLWHTAWRAGIRKMYKAVVGAALRGVQALPGGSGAIEAQLEPELANLRRDLLGEGDADAWTELPRCGLPRAEVLRKALEQKALATGYASGLSWAGIYHAPETELVELQNDVWAAFNNTNTLYPGVFPGIRKMEAELVAMVLAMVHGREAGAVGLLTSGGTESILLAVLGYRQQARARGIDEPEIIAGLSAHPALTKACHYFGVKLLTAPIDPSTLQLRAATVAGLVTARTVAVYASCPTFSHGVIDPIEELGALCEARGLGLHVDNCLGGFLVSRLCKLGLLEQRWDFAVPGVTSISVDLHKYGFASKGVSVVCFREPALRRLTYVPCSDGCEGMYVTPTLQGSRAGAVIAQAWATMLYMGEDRYDAMARELFRLTAEAKRIVRSIPELGLLVNSDAAIVPVVSRSGEVDIYQVAGLLEGKGWNMFTGQHPPVMSMCLGEQHGGLLDRWGADLRQAVAQVRADPELAITGSAAVYGASAAIPDELLDSILRSYCDIRMSVKRASGSPSRSSVSFRHAKGRGAPARRRGHQRALSG